MRTQLNYLLLAVICSVSAAGCRKCNCIDGDISFHFSGYSEAELSTITMQQYAAGANFNQRTDSAYLQNGIHYRLERKGDTLFLNPGESRLKLHKGSDYLISLPAANNNYRITGIEMLQVTDQCNGKTICINPVKSLRINDSLLDKTFPGLPGFTLTK
ncbi:hypothetical protein SAMN05444008_107232 [Cnuella takakiae]|uniref:Lipoprotein n=1 Tax=Cnuella takakiae TaxID=1302690 RepID=A0A1M5BBE1_9BACT|nr:hypothetical protein [Cnuella takakiae]OLY93412.1 hypothetical protein BUE76_17120 [Cnuella takakiae]SHF39637.1 hypothetical protein SAMN05444008_107232 [Cnuella takakiae]